MKLFGLDWLEIDGFFIFFIGLALAWWFEDKFGTTDIYFTYIWLAIPTFFFLVGSSWIDKAKNRSPKAIGRNFINHSILIEYKIELENSTIFSLGGYRDELLFDNKGKDGIVICHNNCFMINGRGIDFLGEEEFIHFSQIDDDTKKIVKDYYGYLPEYFIRIKAIHPEIENFLQHEATNSKIVYQDLISENKKLSSKFNYANDIIKFKFDNTGQILNKAGSYVRGVRKALGSSERRIFDREDKQ